MTPHQILSGMANVVKDVGPSSEEFSDYFDVDIWTDITSYLREAVHFSLGDTHPTMEHEDFALDLFEKDLFKMPFPVTFWTSESPYTKIGILAVENEPSTWSSETIPSQPQARGFSIVMFSIGISDEEIEASCENLDFKVYKDTQFYPISLSRIFYNPIEKVEDRVRVSTVVLSSYSIGHQITGKALDEYKENVEYLAQGAWHYLLGSVALLMTPDVERRIEPAPRKLNAARAKKGKPLICERHTITVKPHAKEVLSGKTTEGMGHTKRPHMRRGHFRTLERGTGEQRVIPVAPCVVGVTKDAQSFLKAKTYEVKT